MRQVRVGLLCAVVACGIAVAGVTAQERGAGDWRLQVRGTRNLRVGGPDLERLLGAHRLEMRLTVKGEERLYSGFPLGWIAALVDDPGEGVGSLFDQELWDQGYEIIVTGSDGYAATLYTGDLAPEDALLADREGGKPIGPSVVGTFDRSLWVEKVVSIELAIEGPFVPDEEFLASLGAGGSSGDAAPDVTVTLALNGVEHAYSIAELQLSPFYVEARGSFTTSVGTTYTALYGGVRLAPLIEQFVTLAPADTVEFVAMDGYRMAYAGAQVLDASSGEWILAFRADGEYLPRDPGYVRTIKVGPDTPNIDGHLSVKMVERVELTQKGYRSFELLVDGAMQAALDRQTLQSCLNCHGVSVQYERKGQAATYRGVALWRLLAYGDDPEWAPHKVPSSVSSYDAEAARQGYPVDVVAADGFLNSLDAKDLDRNDLIILGTLKDGAELPDGEWPAVLAWDKAAVVPEAIKPVRQVVKLVVRPGVR